MREFRRALEYLPRYRVEIATGLLAIPVAQALSMAIPWVIGRGIDELREGRLSMPLSGWFAVIVLLALVRGVAKYVMRRQIVGASRHMEEDLRNDLFRHLLRLAPDDMQSERSGDLMTRLTWDVEAVRMFLGPGVMYVTETLLVLPPALIILATFDVLLATLLLVPLVLIALVMKLSAGPIHAESQRGQERLSDLSNLAQESFAGIRVVRGFAGEEDAIRRFEAASKAYADQMTRVARVRGLAWSSMTAAKDIGVLLLISAGCVQLLRGAITLGEFLVFNMYLGLLFWPMVALGWMIAMYQRAKVSMERISAIFDQPPGLSLVDGAARPDRIRGEVEFRNLRIARAGREILAGIDLRIPAGRILGITGPVGSGKSTLAQVVLRLVDVPAGVAFVDGLDVTRIDPNALRLQIGYVPQEAFLFKDTLRRNLQLGRQADDAALVAALRAAHVDREILSLERGLDSVVGERGVTLSGGQRQRVAIARALVRDPAILILDDCLSAVDAETEARILRSLREVLRGRTTILISHRVAALALADEACVIDGGRIVERGPPDELLRSDGAFRRMFERQRAEQELEQSP